VAQTGHRLEKHSQMRQRFEQQIKIDMIAIADAVINTKRPYAIDELLLTLKTIFTNKEYSEQLFNILECNLCQGKKKTGRPGMDLWQIFVLSQVRLCKNMSYDELHHWANNHKGLRQLLGVEFKECGYTTKPKVFEYQYIYDNISLLNDNIVREINDVVLDFGYKKVFKKKETVALSLKSDSFVVESTVHFPTDYNLLWDGLRRCIVLLKRYLKQNQITGWRKINDWKCRLKGLMRELGKACGSGGKGKDERVQKAAETYIQFAQRFYDKLSADIKEFSMKTESDLDIICKITQFLHLVEKHIDLIDRRIMKGETIPHGEKLFSLFEQYTEWINKGKSNPNVELGKKLCITTDQYNLIVDYQILSNEQDRDMVLELGSRLIDRFPIKSWSFDKGYWRKDNKELLQLYVPQVIMPKLGKRTKQEEDEERGTSFKRLKKKHSAIESNINELEQRGLDRCPDKSFPHFKRYIGLAVCAYNLKKMGRELIKQMVLKDSKLVA
jgi:transposase, IS5 family